MELKDCVQLNYSINKTADKLGIGFYEAKLQLEAYFNDADAFDAYVKNARASSYKHQPKRTPRPKKAPRHRLLGLIAKHSVKSPHLTESYLDDCCKIVDSEAKTVNSVLNFIKNQIKFYRESDWETATESLKIWSGERWHNVMQIDHWIRSFGVIEGTKLFAARKIKCNAFHGKSEEEIAKIKETQLIGLKKYLAGTTKLDRQQSNCRSIEFYLKRGVSREEGEKIISDKLKILFSTTKFGHPPRNLPPEKNSTNIAYWVKKYGEELGPILYKERQQTFSLEKCIKKYGQEKGYLKWRARQEKWQETLNSKSDAKKHEILLKRVTPFGKASKASLKFFDKLCSSIYNENLIDKSLIYIGIGGQKEWFIYDEDKKKIRFYDFCIPELKLIIEFHGKLFHYDKDLGKIPNNVFNFNENETKENDEYKEKLAKSKQFEYLVVWEKDNYDADVQYCLERIRSLCRRC